MKGAFLRMEVNFRSLFWALRLHRKKLSKKQDGSFFSFDRGTSPKIWYISFFFPETGPCKNKIHAGKKIKSKTLKKTVPNHNFHVPNKQTKNSSSSTRAESRCQLTSTSELSVSESSASSTSSFTKLGSI
jgi:hypothetical protein